LSERHNVTLLFHDVAPDYGANYQTLRFGSFYCKSTELRRLWRDVCEKLGGELSFLLKAGPALGDAHREGRPMTAAMALGANFKPGGRIINVSSGTSMLERTNFSNRVGIDEESVVLPLLPPLDCPAADTSLTEC
jgi:hypothetical protein